jgi:hypothetical protein
MLVRDFDDRVAWKKWSFKTCAEWLAWRSEISLSAAREKLRSAHALRMLPAISAAFSEGRLSYSKVRALTRVAHMHDEDLLLAYALTASVQRVEERCRQIRNVTPESAHHARRAWGSRSLSAWRDEARSMMRFIVEVPTDEGELILRALDCAVAAGEVTADVDPDAIGESRGATWRAQQADALVAVAKSYLDGRHASERGTTADHYQVVLHADAKSFAGGAGRADLPIDAMKRLLCDCSLVTVVEGSDDKPLDVGRKQRTISTALRRALYARDRGCTFPGCHRTRYVDGHHLKHWIDGGETALENMTVLCTHHHQMLHEGGFTVVKEDDDQLRFITADGRTIPRNGYRLEDFVDDDVDVGRSMDGERPSREGFRTAQAPPDFERAEVREASAAYRLKASSSAVRRSA